MESKDQLIQMVEMMESSDQEIALLGIDLFKNSKFYEKYSNFGSRTNIFGRIRSIKTEINFINEFVSLNSPVAKYLCSTLIDFINNIFQKM